MEKLCKCKDNCTVVGLVDKLESWHQKLGISGDNTKARVREEVRNLLEKIKEKRGKEN